GLVTGQDRYSQVGGRLLADVLDAELHMASGEVLIDEERLARLNDLGGQPFAEGDGLEVVTVGVGEVDQVILPIEQRHVHDVGLERLAHLLADQLDEGVELELRDEGAAHSVDGFELDGLLPRFVEQSCILESHAHAVRKRGEQTNVGIAESMLPVDVLEAHITPDFLPYRERNEEHGFGHLGAGHGLGPLVAHLDEGIDKVLLDVDDGVFRNQALSQEVQRTRLAKNPFALLDVVAMMFEAGGVVNGGDDENLRVKEVTDAIPHQVIDALHLELGDEPLLHAVDHGQLRVALVGLLEQASRFVEQAGVFEGHAQAVRERGQSADVLVGEGVLAVHVLKAYVAEHLIAHDHRHEERRFGDLALRHDLVRVPLDEFREASIDQKRFTLVDEVSNEAIDGCGGYMEPLAFFDEIAIVLQTL